MIKKKHIRFETLDDVNRFMNKIQHTESELVLSNGESEIDTQSILSLLSLGFRHPVQASYLADDKKVTEILEEFAIS